MTASTTELASSFLFKEARLLDSGDFRAWLALFDDPAEYWVPVSWTQTSPLKELSIIYDTRQMLEARIFRLQHETIVSQDPPSRVCRLVSNIEVTADANAIEVNSCLMMCEWRKGRQFNHSARVLHRLRLVHSELRIAKKRVDLINSEGQLEMISVPF